MTLLGGITGNVLTPLKDSRNINILVNSLWHVADEMLKRLAMGASEPLDEGDYYWLAVVP